jgi:hypothetical protein
MPVTISARVTPETAERLREYAQLEDRSLSDIVNRALDEYVRSAGFPGIVFVTGGSGRRKAKLLGGPDVWSVIFIARSHDMNPEETAQHLEIPVASVRLALAYYEAYPDEIDARLRRTAEHDSNASRLLPFARVIHLPDRDDAPTA